MASSNDNVSMALFCDFENVALGVRDANYDKFDIKPVLERLLLKGSIVVKKAYCDWDRYKGFKAPMHEANFELIEIPHVRQSGKNSADIRMVVDALDLCYTKSHVDTFVIISGDSDFSPLVSKLRENAKKVIGVGVKQSTSDLLVANCDEFIFYDDLVRESRRAAAKRDPREAAPAVKRSPEEEKRRREDMDKRRSQAVEIAVETFDALVSERGDSGKIWASVLKEAIKRRKPDFSESYYGFRTFGNLLEEARARGLLEFGRDDKSGAYVYRSNGSAVAAETLALAPEQLNGGEPGEARAETRNEARPEARPEARRGRGRGGRSAAERYADRQAERSQERQAPVFAEAADGAEPSVQAVLPASDEAQVEPLAQQADAGVAVAQDEAVRSDSRRGRGNRGARKPAAAKLDVAESVAPEVIAEPAVLPAEAEQQAALEAEAIAAAEQSPEVLARAIRNTSRKPAAKKPKAASKSANKDANKDPAKDANKDAAKDGNSDASELANKDANKPAGKAPGRAAGKSKVRPAAAAAPAVVAADAPLPEAAPAVAEPEAAPAKAAKKPASRSRRPARKPAAQTES